MAYIDLWNTDQQTNNETTSSDFSWKEAFFKKFEWLNEEPLYMNDICMKTEELRNQIRSQIIGEGEFHTMMNSSRSNGASLRSTLQNELYLYFISLKNNKMLLHATFDKSDEQILQDCVGLYEYAKINDPIKIVYKMENIDLYDIDKNVKIFMQLFGEDNCRGGSYTNVVLPYHMKQTLKREFEITASIDYYIQRERELSDTINSSTVSENEEIS